MAPPATLITNDQFARRRQQLMELAGRRRHYPDGRPGQAPQQRCGLQVPATVRVLVLHRLRRTRRGGSAPSRSCRNPMRCFVRPYDERFQIWVGYRAGVEGAVAQHGADAAYPIEDLKEELPKLLEAADTVYYGLGADDEMDQIIADLTRRRRAGTQRGGRPLAGIQDPKPVIDRMRLIKSPEEIAALQQAIDLTERGFDAAMRSTRPGDYEYQVQAELESVFRRLGSPRNGYPSIVAFGNETPAPCTTSPTGSGCRTGTCCSSTPAPRLTTTRRTSPGPGRLTGSSRRHSGPCMTLPWKPNGRHSRPSSRARSSTMFTVPRCVPSSRV